MQNFWLRPNLQLLALSLSCLSVGLLGCDDSDGDDAEGAEASSVESRSGRSSSGTKDDAKDDDATSSMAGASASADAKCDPSAKELEVSEDISEDTTWTCGTYLLQKLVFVTDDATLKIEPGVQVLGDTDQQGVVTALIATRGARLEAVGTKDAPIVFSSGNPEGARAPGDWGGVVMLGKAKVNTGACKGGEGDSCNGGYFETNIDGLDPTDPKSLYGGTDDAYDCGRVEYARIEFAGFQLSVDNELNGLTLGGCGSDTKLSYVQVHHGSDDGIEFFGGTVGIDHAVVSAPSDDGLDWDFGWRGNVQFAIVHQASNDGDKGLEGDNLGENEQATPRSNPSMYNVTLLGNPTKVGALLREGTQGTLRNFIVQGFASAIDLAAAQVSLADEWPDQLSIEDSVFFDNEAVGDGDSMDDDQNFNEDDVLKDEARNNVFDVDPEFPSTDVGKPNYKPGNPAALSGKATPPSGFDTKADYAGAVDPAGEDWTKGWTAFPDN